MYWRHKKKTTSKSGLHKKGIEIQSGFIRSHRPLCQCYHWYHPL